MLYQYLDYRPDVAPDVFVAPGVHIIGKVKIAAGSSIWFNTVVRGDVNEITIGRFTNIQAVGTPARVVRELKSEEIARIRHVTEIYAQRAQEYIRSLKQL